MKKLTDLQKNIIKWIFVLIIIGLIIYAFRDSAGPIAKQLGKTSLKVLGWILVCSFAYEFFESIITWVLAKKYNKDFKFLDAIAMTYFCSFYRVASLGSGAGVAAVVYMNSCGIKASEALGMYTLEYAIHKLSTAILAAFLFITNFAFMRVQFHSYKWYLILGFIGTVIITAFLVLFACASWFHKFLYFLMEKLNFRGKFTKTFNKVREQCEIMEETSKTLLHNYRILFHVLILNLIKFCCWYIIPFFVMAETGKVQPYQCLGITAVCVMLAAVIPTPAGIGASEVVMIGFYSGLVGSATAGAMSLLYRFATFIVPFLVGIFVAIYFHKFRVKDVDIIHELTE